jgi:hypothetical protein
VKSLQRATKQLLQEIELNDGKVSWMGNHAFDKSRALTLEDELHDKPKREHHWAVFQNKRLLRFLTLGDIEHFLYSDDYFPRETLELLEDEPEFVAFLSKPFARQYNFVLSRAIDRRLVSVVEALFDGRRWVEPGEDDICFEGAYRRIRALVEAARAIAQEGRQRKIGVPEMEEFLRKHSFHPELFNHLPAPFRSLQNEVVAEIRSLAVSSYNEHGDTELSQAVLDLSKHFQFKNVDLNKRLEEDFKTIGRLSAEERKYEFKAIIRKDFPVHITKDELRAGPRRVRNDAIHSVSWGITAIDDGNVTRHRFSLSFQAGDGTNVDVNWRSNCATGPAISDSSPFSRSSFLRHSSRQSIWIEENPLEQQKEAFRGLIQAALNYIVPRLTQRLVEAIRQGLQVTIGHLSLHRQGIGFQTQGLIFKKDHLLLWPDVSTEMRNGQMAVFSGSQPSLCTTVSAQDTNNAVLLPIIREMMEKESAKQIPTYGY